MELDIKAIGVLFSIAVTIGGFIYSIATIHAKVKANEKRSEDTENKCSSDNSELKDSLKEHIRSNSDAVKVLSERIEKQNERLIERDLVYRDKLDQVISNVNDIHKEMLRKMPPPE